MQCSHCNQEHPEGILFCPLTGKKIITAEVCPECGKPVDLNWPHCTNCGRSLNQPEISDQPGVQTAGFIKTRWPIIVGWICGLILMVAIVFAIIRGGAPPGDAIPSVTATPAEARIPLEISTPTITPTPVSTSDSPSSAQYSGKIVFASSREGDDESMGSSKIYAMNADGSNQSRLGDLDIGRSPSLSADGQKITFVSGNGIYGMNVGGSNRIRLTENLGSDIYDLAPCWSGDGQQIAFASNRDGNFEIYVMNADGSDQKRLTYFQADDTDPAWSADGQRIAFTSFRDGYAEIYVMNADGNNQIRLTTNSWVDSYPSWSADGQKIAFQSHREGSQGMDIYIMNADGSNQTRLTNNTSPDYFPIWLGNGKIAFTSERDGNTEIYIMNADGSDQTRLTNNTMSDSFRGYSPYVPGQQPSLPQQPALPLP